MAYLHDDDKPEMEQNKPPAGASRGSGLLTDYTATANMARTPDPYNSPSSGPSVTGHVNFDRIYAANEATAQRDAAKMNAGAHVAANNARKGLTGLQQQFASQSKGAGGFAPTQTQQAWSQGVGRSEDKPGRFGGAEYTAKVQADTQNAANASYGGPNSLQDVKGYQGVLNGYLDAQNATKALEDNAHIQGALEQNKQSPHIEGGTRLDAALIGQAGRERFADTRRELGGLGKELGAATKASVNEADAARAAAQGNAAAHQGLLDRYGKVGAGELGDEVAPNAGWRPPGGGYNEFMNAGGGDKASIHNAGRALDPLDQFMKWLGQEGVYQGEGSTDMFSDVIGGQYGGPNNAEQKTANVRNAFGDISKGYGNSAAQWLFEHMTEAEWNSYSGMNSGAILRLMRQKLDAAIAAGEFTTSAPGSAGGVPSEVRQAGGGGGAAAVAKEQGTTEADETRRNQASADGWLTEYDRQWREGIRPPVKP